MIKSPKSPKECDLQNHQSQHLNASTFKEACNVFVGALIHIKYKY
jgi:hypothetical protein